MKCLEMHEKVKNIRTMKWGYETISCNNCGKGYTTIKFISAFVKKLLGMKHDERQSCLKRLSVPRMMNIYDICTTILSGKVGSDNTFLIKYGIMNMILGK